MPIVTSFSVNLPDNRNLTKFLRVTDHADFKFDVNFWIAIACIIDTGHQQRTQYFCNQPSHLLLEIVLNSCHLINLQKYWVTVGVLYL